MRRAPPARMRRRPAPAVPGRRWSAAARVACAGGRRGQRPRVSSARTWPGAASAVRLASTTNSRASRSIASTAAASAGTGAAVSVSRARPSRHSKLASAAVSWCWPSARSIALRADCVVERRRRGGAVQRREVDGGRAAGGERRRRARRGGALRREVAGERQPQQRPRQQRNEQRSERSQRAPLAGALAVPPVNPLRADATGRHHDPPMRSRTPAALLAASAGAPAALSRASRAPSAAASSGASSRVQAPLA